MWKQSPLLRARDLSSRSSPCGYSSKHDTYPASHTYLLPRILFVLRCICASSIRSQTVRQVTDLFMIRFSTRSASGVMTYSTDIITAEPSNLKNRGPAYAVTSSPYIITAFAGPKASDDFYYKISWRCGFGTFAIVLPIVAAPLYTILKLNLRNAGKRGLLTREKSGRTLSQNIWHYIQEFGSQSPFAAVSPAATIILTLP